MSALTKATDDVVRVETALSEAKAHLATLDEARGRIVLEGGDVDAYHVELIKAEANVKTLEAALAMAKDVEAAAAANARKRALEAQARAVRTDTVAAIATRREEAQQMLEKATGALQELGALEDEVKTFNEQMRQAGRDDLAVHVEAMLTVAAMTPRPPALLREPQETAEAYAARQKTADKLWAEQKAHAERDREPLENEADFRARQDEAVRQVKRRKHEDERSYGPRVAEAKARVIRRGETDEAYATRSAGARLGVYRGENESDAGFGLRVANARSAQHRSSEIANPLRAAGDAALETIQKYALDMSPQERRRKFPDAHNPHAVIGADDRAVLRPHLWPENQTRLRPSR
jgi:hypothetical protein